VEKNEPLHTVGGNVSYYRDYGKQCGLYTKPKTRTPLVVLDVDPSPLYVDINLKKMKSGYKKLFIAPFFTIAKV
jgi:hypothetical protein